MERTLLQLKEKNVPYLALKQRYSIHDISLLNDIALPYEFYASVFAGDHLVQLIKLNDRAVHYFISRRLAILLDMT